MIGVDTNVLVRYLVEDDPDQTGVVKYLFATFAAESPGFVSLVAMVETVWVLERVYAIDQNSAMSFALALTAAPEIVVDHADLVTQAARSSVAGADFADVVIALLGSARGCSSTVTFDKGAAAAAGMTLLGRRT